MCGIFTENHATDLNYPKLKELQVGEVQAVDYLYYMAPRRTWKPRMPQNFPQQNPHNFQYPQNSWNTPMPWQAWHPEQYQNQPTKGWRGYGYGNQPPQHMYPQQYQYQQPYPSQPFPQYQKYHQHQNFPFPPQNQPMLTQP